MLGAVSAWSALVAGFASPSTCKKSYVVVGAGGGGAPMAYGLAKAGCKVTVIEKGPDDDWTGPWIDGTPDGFPLWTWELSWNAAQSFINWDIGSAFFSLPVWNAAAPRDQSAQPICTTYCENGPTMGNNTLDSLKERVYSSNIVGGNTAHNLGFWLRGDCTVYEMYGEGWSCAETTAAFEELEAMYAAVAGTPYGGMMEAEKMGFLTAADVATTEGLEAAGFTKVPGVEIGSKGMVNTYGYTTWTTAATGSEWFPGEAARITSGKVFIDPLREMKDFTLITGAWAQKLLFAEGGEPTVIGLEYTTGYKTGDWSAVTSNTIMADEVILALGGLSTPQLLMVSGIGPKAMLEGLGITVMKDLPVGSTYQNHAWAPGMYCKLPEMLESAQPGVSEEVFAIKPPLIGKETPYPKNNGNVFALGTSPFTEIPGVADYNFAFLNNVEGSALATFADPFGGCPEPVTSVSVVVVGTMLSKARGYFTIVSDSMHDDPEYYPGFYTGTDDAYLFATAFQKLREVLTPVGMVELVPGAVFDFSGGGDMATSAATWVAAAMGTFWHDSATCPIGLVVDSDLKVMGVKGLRLSDVSVQPLIANVPTSPIAHAIGFIGSKKVLKEAYD